MRFEQVEVGFAAVGGGVPEHVVVVGEVGEEDAQEETCCCEDVVSWCCVVIVGMRRDVLRLWWTGVRLRPMTMNCAKVVPAILVDGTAEYAQGMWGGMS